jgi:transcriptional regulator with XRE-family HTH domain
VSVSSGDVSQLSPARAASDAAASAALSANLRRRYERTRLANDVAIRVIQYRVKHGLSQSELARRLGMRQPNAARLEPGEHEPTIATLSLLARALKQDFSVDVKPSRMRRRRPAPSIGDRTPARRTGRGGRRTLSPAASASSVQPATPSP